MTETACTWQATTEYICPVHGKIGNEWRNKAIRFEDGSFHCMLCLRDLLAEKLPAVVIKEKKCDV